MTNYSVFPSLTQLITCNIYLLCFTQMKLYPIEKKFDCVLKAVLITDKDVDDHFAVLEQQVNYNSRELTQLRCHYHVCNHSHLADRNQNNCGNPNRLHILRRSYNSQ